MATLGGIDHYLRPLHRTHKALSDSNGPKWDTMTARSIRELARAGIRPVLENRRLWKDERERLLGGHDGTTNVVYDEAGTLYGYDRSQEPLVTHTMAYVGYEPERRTIKYRSIPRELFIHLFQQHGYRLAAKLPELLAYDRFDGSCWDLPLFHLGINALHFLSETLYHGVHQLFVVHWVVLQILTTSSDYPISPRR